MVGPSTCKYRIHVEATRYRPQLELAQKQVMHERAMAQWELDPLRTDYSRSVLLARYLEFSFPLLPSPPLFSLCALFSPCPLYV